MSWKGGYHLGMFPRKISSSLGLYDASWDRLNWSGSVLSRPAETSRYIPAANLYSFIGHLLLYWVKLRISSFTVYRNVAEYFSVYGLSKGYWVFLHLPSIKTLLGISPFTSVDVRLGSRRFLSFVLLVLCLSWRKRDWREMYPKW